MHAIIGLCSIVLPQCFIIAYFFTYICFRCAGCGGAISIDPLSLSPYLSLDNLYSFHLSQSLLLLPMGAHAVVYKGDSVHRVATYK